jgi:hypothetical protein
MEETDRLDLDQIRPLLPLELLLLFPTRVEVLLHFIHPKLILLHDRLVIGCGLLHLGLGRFELPGEVVVGLLEVRELVVEVGDGGRGSVRVALLGV